MGCHFVGLGITRLVADKQKIADWCSAEGVRDWQMDLNQNEIVIALLILITSFLFTACLLWEHEVVSLFGIER